MSTKWAYLDESKSNSYIVSAVIVSRHSAPGIRNVISGLRLPGQRRVHFKHESTSRRREILAKINHLDFQVVTVSIPNEYEVTARRKALTQLFESLQSAGVTLVTLEKDESMVKHDRQTISNYLSQVPQALRAEYRIIDAYQEPLLWLADIAAWLAGKGKKVGRTY